MVLLLQKIQQLQAFYIFEFISDTVALQKDITISGQVIKTGKLDAKDIYLISIKDNINWYW